MGFVLVSPLDLPLLLNLVFLGPLGTGLFAMEGKTFAALCGGRIWASNATERRGLLGEREH